MEPCPACGGDCNQLADSVEVEAEFPPIHPNECPICGATDWDYTLTPEGHVTTCCQQPQS